MPGVGTGTATALPTGACGGSKTPGAEDGEAACADVIGGVAGELEGRHGGSGVELQPASSMAPAATTASNLDGPAADVRQGGRCAVEFSLFMLSLNGCVRIGHHITRPAMPGMQALAYTRGLNRPVHRLHA